MKKLIGKITTKRMLFLVVTFFFFSLVLTTFFSSYGEFVSRLNRQNSGVVDNIVYVNDSESDYYYYTGQNYTTATNTTTLPTLVDKNLYNNNNLVELKVTYLSTDNVATNLKGYVSTATTERQDTFIYYKFLPVNDNGTASNKTDDYVLIELIDNPFAYRPNDYGFNGWVTNYTGASIYLDTTIYVRYAKVPVSYTNNIPNVVDITFNAKWINSKRVSLNDYRGNWNNTFNALDAPGFIQMGSEYPIYEDMSPYYEVVRWSSNSLTAVMPAGALDENLNDISGNPCIWWCQYYVHADPEYDSNKEYYRHTNYGMEWYGAQIIGYVGDPGVPIGSNIAGYYKKVHVDRNQTATNVYNSGGNYLASVTCNTSGGCDYYELQQYYLPNGNPNVAVAERNLYYKVTRDTNIIFFDRTVNTEWGDTTKPFTLTGIENGALNSNSYTISNINFTAYSDMRLEHFMIYSNIRRSTTTPVSYTQYNTVVGFIVGNDHNLKIGRGITQRGANYVNASAVIAGPLTGYYTRTVGSNSAPLKSRLIVESGVYNDLSASVGSLNGNTRTTFYISTELIAGCDYDRAKKNNDDLEVYENMNGTFGGLYEKGTGVDYLFSTTLKSGEIGTSRNSYTTGIYVGGRGYQGDSIGGPVRLKVEGGWAYNIIGGPLIPQSLRTTNIVNVAMTGGEVDSIFGGAGDAATYGNRIIAVTGGTVNYSVFGGSNGYQSDEGKGTLNGSTYIYIGGRATIGNETYVNNNTNSSFGFESGSVFGIGNGKTGSSTIGSCDNSNIVIADYAHILRNVYGGGNYGAVGVNSSATTTTTNIKMVDGSVDGSIYGGGNNNGSGSSSKASTINIEIDKGTVGNNVYGGSRNLGRVYGDTNVSVYGGTVKNVYGGGEGGYTNNTNYGTFVTGNVNVTIGDSNKSTTPTVTKVYGGSAFGTVNGNANNNTTTNKTTKVTVNKGNVTTVFGGGEGNNTYTPYVTGSVEVTINGGTITDVYGGNDQKGTPNGDIDVYIKGGTSTNVYGGGNLAAIKTSDVYLQGGTATNVYGGGNLANATTTNVYLQGSTTTSIYGGSNQSGTVTTATVRATSGTASTIYGGNNLGGTTTTANVTIAGGNVTTVFGGGNEATTGTTNVTLNGSNISNVYGGGNKAGITTSSTVTLSGSTVTNIYGGSNESGNVPTATINTTSGSATTIYGGNNLGGKTTNSRINVNGATIGTIYGGGNEAETGNSIVNLNASTIGSVYGGGNKAGMTTTTAINLGGSTVTNIFGGSNVSGNVQTATITTTSGSATTIYGGNNLGGKTTNSRININGATIGTIYGGGYEAETDNSIVNLNASTVTTVYGGGNKAGMTSFTTINQAGSTVTNMYGGSNVSGTVPVSNITTTGGTTTNMYGGNNQGGTTTTTNIDINGGSVTDVYGGGNEADSTTTNITVTALASKCSNIYGGGNKASVTTSNIEIKNGVSIGNVYGGSNTSGIVDTSNISLPNSTNKPNVDVIYGGNNRGGKTNAANIDIRNGTIGYVYGGGNLADTNSTTTTIGRATVTHDVYGGGNQASVINGVTLTLNGATVGGNVFGGGNLGAIGEDTNVHVTDSTIGNSLYAGGNGSTAIVNGSTYLDVDGTTNVTNHVFGGGNAAATGNSEDNDSESVVNIAGLTTGGNVYGGANTSVLYGVTNVNIGSNAVNKTGLKTGNIHIGGTVFGGGEANASGSEIYDFSFISVTEGINIKIDGSNHGQFAIDGSIFGSGNASSTSGYSDVVIKNYGTENNYKTNVSIQRASKVTLENSAILLVGATDRTNEYSDVLFSLSRIDEIKLTNNSILYLENSTNLVKKFTSSLVNGNTETKASVSIDNNGNTTSNVNNKVYIYEGRNINIATNENVTAYGEVSGMTFFGMYIYDRYDRVDKGYFKSNYNNNSNVPTNELILFNSGSYVLGEHSENHNFEVDGFYSVFPVNEEGVNNRVTMEYIKPTPDEADFYMWSIGEPVISYEIDITASKYSTLGTYELPLINFPNPNTIFSVLGFNYNGLEADVVLTNKDAIPRIADTANEADNVMSLVMASSDNGWITKGKTTFLTNNAYFTGTSNYLSENSSVVPTFLFYLYHSKNLHSPGDMGTAIISLVAITPVDDLNNEVKRVNIIVNLSRAIYSTDDYEGTLTKGKAYEMFAPGEVNITANSSFSAYYSLFMTSNQSIYRTGYHRVLSSTYNFPANTKITMIDLLSGTTPEYYYYVVSQADYNSRVNELATNGDVTYPLSQFVKMGSSNSANHYDDVAKNVQYWDTTHNIAEEEFIFIVDFKESNIDQDVIEKSLLLELRSSDNQIILSVIGVEQQQLFFNLYTNKEAVINVTGNMSTTDVYIGEPVGLTVNTNFVQKKVGSNTVVDTNFYDYKTGIKISILDSNGNLVTGPNMMGISYTIGNNTYYPRFDGTVRINIAERVANVNTQITINTEGSSIASGNYKLLVESFGSADGIYYGLTSSDSMEIPFSVKNTIFGLKASINNKQLIVNKTTGLTEDSTNAMAVNLQYSSGLVNPHLRISLYRRSYDDVYSDTYNLVDFKDVFTNELDTTNKENEYMLFETPESIMSTTLYLKPDLISGTYKLVFSLYDNDTYIGDTYKYVIIK